MIRSIVEFLERRSGRGKERKGASRADREDDPPIGRGRPADLEDKAVQEEILQRVFPRTISDDRTAKEERATREFFRARDPRSEILRKSRDGTRAQRIAAIEVLGALREEWCYPAVARAMEDSNSMVRSHARWTLEKFDSPQALEEMSRRLESGRCYGEGARKVIRRLAEEGSRASIDRALELIDGAFRREDAVATELLPAFFDALPSSAASAAHLERFVLDSRTCVAAVGVAVESDLRGRLSDRAEVVCAWMSRPEDRGPDERSRYPRRAAKAVARDAGSGLLARLCAAGLLAQVPGDEGATRRAAEVVDSAQGDPGIPPAAVGKLIRMLATTRYLPEHLKALEDRAELGGIKPGEVRRWQEAYCVRVLEQSRKNHVTVRFEYGAPWEDDKAGPLVVHGIRHDGRFSEVLRWNYRFSNIIVHMYGYTRSVGVLSVDLVTFSIGGQTVCTCPKCRRPRALYVDVVEDDDLTFDFTRCRACGYERKKGA